jgi:hypothetical protein
MSGQKDNVVGGDQAGRDIVKTYGPQIPRLSYMTRLVERFKHERENDIQFHQILDRLQDYCSNVDDQGATVMGLDEKLGAGNFLGFSEFAKRTKEAFCKKLLKLQLYESAQIIFVHVLAEIYTRYYNFIYPLIQAKAPDQTIHETIHEKIVEPVHEMLEDNVLDLFADEINGAIYFLTGNCHIKWV